MGRDQGVEMFQADLGSHVTEIEVSVGGAVHRDADQAGVLPLPGGGVDRVHMPAEFNIFQVGVGLE
jgi:hypothetical protein